MVIPRENNMVRLYIQIASSTDADWSPRQTATEQQVQASAKRILQPYSIAWDRVEWFSVYPIGQGIAEKYTLDHRVFLGGDACHTHSASDAREQKSRRTFCSPSEQPKAGQGMNTAFLDALNLAWKMHLVERGFARRSLLHTYEPERKEVAEALLAFDNKYAELFSQRPPAASEVEAASATDGVDNDFVKTFKEACEFTSGYGVAYSANALNWSRAHPAQSHVILEPAPPSPPSAPASASAAVTRTRPPSKLCPGRIFPNADVTRVVDANVVHLEQQIPLNGSFRLFIFAGRPSAPKCARALADLATGLAHRTSFYTAYARPDADAVSHHERHNPHSHFFTCAVVLAAPRARVDIRRDVPPLLARYREHVYADDRVDWRFVRPSEDGGRTASPTGAAHAKMGLDPEAEGAVVVVRPDGYVGVVVRLVEGNATLDALNAYFGAFCTKTLGEAAAQL